MAATLVRTTPAGSSENSAAGTSLTCTVTCTIGETLWVIGQHLNDLGNTTTFSGGGNTYVPLDTQTDAAGTNEAHAYVTSTASGSFTLTMTTPSNRVRAVAVYRLSGVDGTSPVTAHKAGYTATPGLGNDGIVTGTATNTITGLMMAAAIDTFDGASTANAGTGFTDDGTVWTATTIPARIESKTIATTGSAVQATFTALSNVGHASFMAVFSDSQATASIIGNVPKQGPTATRFGFAGPAQPSRDMPGNVAYQRPIAALVASNTNVSVSLVGQAITSTLGTVTPTVSYAVTGQALTSTEGAPTVGVTYAVTGQSIASTEGAITSAISYSLTGQGITSTEGTPTYTVSYGVTGQLATFTEGAITAAWGGSATLGGQAIASALGTITPIVSYAVNGQALTSTEGVIGPELDYAVAGQAITSTEGTITKQGDVTIQLAGQSLSLQIGVVTATGGDVALPVPAVQTQGGAGFVKGGKRKKSEFGPYMREGQVFGEEYPPSPFMGPPTPKAAPTLEIQRDTTPVVSQDATHDIADTADRRKSKALALLHLFMHM